MNEKTVLLRQIHQSFLEGDLPTSQAFRPSSRESYKLSVYDGDRISAELAFQHYTQELKLGSIGVMGVAVCECEAAGLTVHSDPAEFEEHVLVDFSAHGRRAIDRKAKFLLALTIERGWLYRA